MPVEAQIRELFEQREGLNTLVKTPSAIAEHFVDRINDLEKDGSVVIGLFTERCTVPEDGPPRKLRTGLFEIAIVRTPEPSTVAPAAPGSPPDELAHRESNVLRTT